eukprot:m.72804 g.72804  ORF g.72804 m.72804 type:complete len:74 (+) comp35816_c0_seq1:1058-1279(+)
MPVHKLEDFCDGPCEKMTFLHLILQLHCSEGSSFGEYHYRLAFNTVAKMVTNRSMRIAAKKRLAYFNDCEAEG